MPQSTRLPPAGPLRHRLGASVAAIVLAIVLSVVLSHAAAAAERVSIRTGGGEGNLSSACAAVSADGRIVAFQSAATNLVPGDTNDESDIFVHDRTTETTERVSVSSGGAEANGQSSCPVLSDDGRFVGFASEATNLVAGDANGQTDIFLHDRLTGTTERVSVADGGGEGNRASSAPSVSADGRFVAFVSLATNLVAGDGNGAEDVFVRDRLAGTTVRASVDGGGAEANGASGHPSLSADGRFVAFHSSATNLVPADGNGARDVFVHDRMTGAIERVSVDDAGTEGNGASGDPSLSADGRVVAFESAATNLAPGDGNGVGDVFVHHRDTATTERVSLASNGAQGDSGSGNAAISGDGSFVAFISNASTLVLGDTNGVNDVFVHDRTTGSTTRASVAADGTQGDATSGGAFSQIDISADGLTVGFQSNATNLVDDDTNGRGDVFVSAVNVGAGRRFDTSVKVVCGTSRGEDPLELVLAPGFYTTSVNIHHPAQGSARLYKKLALTYPPGGQLPGEILPIAEDVLGYDQALQSDCVDLRHRLFPAGDAPELFEGFLVVQSSTELDVTSVYSTAALDFEGRPADHSSIHVERVPARDMGVDLRVEKTAQTLRFPVTDLVTLHTVLYTVDVQNPGPNDATGVRVVDELTLELVDAVGAVVFLDMPIDLPAGGALVSNVATATGATLELSLAGLAAGDAATFRFWALANVGVEIDGQPSARLTNEVRVTSQEPETAPNDNVDVVDTVLFP